MITHPQSVLDTIGSTPLVELPRLAPKPGVRIFAKLEGQNPSGSVKDRVARALVEECEGRHQLKPGSLLVEASTGNTAIALAVVAKQKGYRLKVVVPEGVAPSIGYILDTLGVECVESPPKAGMRGAIEAAARLAQAEGGVLTGQFFSQANVDAHYHGTGAEILAQLPSVTHFVAGIGTGGTVTGVANCLKDHLPHVRVVGVEPHMGEVLQGIRCVDEGFAPPLLDLGRLDGRFLVSAAQALQLCKRVAVEEGLLVGVSSGATLHVALRLAERVDSADIVCMFADSGAKYLPASPWEAAMAQDPRLDEVHWW
jgi:cysteine synthase